MRCVITFGKQEKLNTERKITGIMRLAVEYVLNSSKEDFSP